DRCAGDRTPQFADASERSGAGAGTGRAGSSRPEDADAGAQGATEEEGGERPAMSATTIEATGETVGEAKWAALRELEQRHPGLDKSAVRFEVISEGERGLLGVGYSPARVIASVSEEAVEAVAIDESALASDVRVLVGRISGTLGVNGHLDVREDDGAVTATVSAADVALLIGRHGQTIDAIQYLMNAITHRTYGDDRKD